VLEIRHFRIALARVATDRAAVLQSRQDELMDASTIATLRQRIGDELAETERLLADNAADSEPVELDQQSVGRVSRIDAIQVQAMAQAVVQRREARLGKLRAALARMDDGEYCYCMECGEEIAAGRLDADPTFTHCVSCAGKRQVK
jgi:DnaK suppressor protein